jgi:hypothetical protein
MADAVVRQHGEGGVGPACASDCVARVGGERVGALADMKRKGLVWREVLQIEMKRRCFVHDTPCINPIFVDKNGNLPVPVVQFASQAGDFAAGSSFHPYHLY